MKTKNWIETKNLSEVELNSKLINMQDELFNMKFRNSTSPIKNPLKIRILRKDVARLKTLLNQKKTIK
ncbi:MAG: 50S ribosomal protein L29 [Elusimicrobiota bacterium]|jgi:large subunit ribosomal protein L29|nr:50S ribosomal protein L29 [Elusimicrobiota bacterium]